MKILKISRLLGFILAITHNTEANADDTATPTTQISPDGRIANRVSEATTVKVSKCCPENQNLDLTNPTHPACVEVEVSESPFIKMKGLDMNSKNSKVVDIQLVKNDEQPHGLPPCFSDFEVHRIESNGKGTQYQPSGARGTGSPPATPHRMQHPKWPLGGPKMADGAWIGVFP